ncbi:MAG: branched-chain amino acid ABC transporter permease, partial [Firmicutes bacterium]|nr:branched-chain amino acid ABC transporter permease [Bacillota bacterium]
MRTILGRDRVNSLPSRFLLALGVLILLEIFIWLRVLNDFWTLTLISICINVILATSLNLINGFTGQFSL